MRSRTNGTCKNASRSGIDDKRQSVRTAVCQSSLGRRWRRQGEASVCILRRPGSDRAGVVASWLGRGPFLLSLGLLAAVLGPAIMDQLVVEVPSPLIRRGALRRATGS